MTHPLTYANAVAGIAPAWGGIWMRIALLAPTTATIQRSPTFGSVDRQRHFPGARALPTMPSEG